MQAVVNHNFTITIIHNKKDMKHRLNFFALTLLTLAGCSNNPDTLTTDDNAESAVVNAQETLQAQFSGATFASIDVIDGVSDENAGDGVVSFTADMVTWAHSNSVETGSYSNNSDSGGTAEFDDRQIAFSADGGNLVWDSKNYHRGATAQFDSQSSLVAYLDGTTYKTVEESLIGETEDGSSAYGHSSIWFDDDEAEIQDADAVLVASYTYINGSSFSVDSLDASSTVTILDGNRLVYNSALYEQFFTTQFVSQETLISFLDGTSYRSVNLHDIGEPYADLTALGHWYVDFTQNTVTWSYQDVSEVGTVAFTQSDNFDITLSDRSYSVVVDGNDIVLDDVRYSKVTGQ